VSARKIGFLVLVLLFGAVLETSWSIRERGFMLGPEGCRVLGGRFYGPSYTFEEAASSAIPEGEAPRVEVQDEFGDVKVEPGDGPDVQIRLRKVVYLPTEEKARAFAERIELRTETDGDRLRVRTNRDELDRGSNVGFETHIELRVPAPCAVDVRNDHGAVELRGVSRATVRASFGDVVVEDVADFVSIEARHGAVRVGDVSSGLSVDARHGDVEIEGVGGPTELKVEHGAVRARRTAGLEARVSFGELTAEGVDGDLAVVSSHGAVTVANVTGRADVETSFAGIRLTGVGGDARAKTQHGSVRAVDVAGALVAETTHGDVEVERVAGPSEVSVQNGGVTARDLRGEVKVRASRGDVSIDGFEGSIDVAVEHAGTHLSAGTPILKPITASAADVRLEVPPGSRFDLDAHSRDGEIRLDLPGLEAVTPGEEGRSRATATVGGGGALVKLRADGEVVVVSQPATTTPEAE
jgi:DUF4097 and DUF4098 domain-containing protein YvlB